MHSGYSPHMLLLLIQYKCPGHPRLHIIPLGDPYEGVLLHKVLSFKKKKRMVCKYLAKRCSLGCIWGTLAGKFDATLQQSLTWIVKAGAKGPGLRLPGGCARSARSGTPERWGSGVSHVLLTCILPLSCNEHESYVKRDTRQPVPTCLKTHTQYPRYAGSTSEGPRRAAVPAPLPASRDGSQTSRSEARCEGGDVFMGQGFSRRP